MKDSRNLPTRRSFLKSAAVAGAGLAITRTGGAEAQAAATKSLFDGKTLDGWIDILNSATAFGGGDIVDLAGLAKRFTTKSDPLSAFLGEDLDESVRALLAAAPATPAEAKAVKSALAKNLSRIISSASLYDARRFQAVPLRPQTRRLLAEEPKGRESVHLNRMLLEDAFPAELAQSPASGWEVKDGAIASTGVGRGVIYTAGDYGRFRLMFTMRHVAGNPDHQACVLIFCTRPEPEEIPLDALGGIQFQVPKGGHWDYRPGHNNAGGEEFTSVVKPDYDPHQWSRVEILADAARGTARMAVAQPAAAKAVEVLDFKDPAAGKSGPIALQMHNAGLFDEYRDIVIEASPRSDELLTLK